jgi:similar to stage IV sporulation protein
LLGIEWPDVIKGKVFVECSGAISVLLDHAYQAGISMENIYWVDEHKIELMVLYPDFFRFAKIVRTLPVRMKISKKVGYPFVVGQIKRQKSLYMGALLFIVLVWMMSSFVWKVQIEGTERIAPAYVRSLLSKEGIYEGQLKLRLPDPQELQLHLADQLPQASWIGFRIEGTRVVITVAEKKVVKSDPPKFPDLGPVHLVSKKNAWVTDVQSDRGNPMVEVHDMVKKGQLLISGQYGDPIQPNTGKMVGAKGKVMGEVWYESEIHIPLERQQKGYTGDREERTFPYIGSWIIHNPFEKKITYPQFETNQQIQPLYWWKWQLPIGLIQEEYFEMEWVNQKLTYQEAIQSGIEEAREELKPLIGEDGKIVEEKILHQSVESGKVYLKVHFDVVENIAIPQPMLQGE